VRFGEPRGLQNALIDILPDGPAGMATGFTYTLPSPAPGFQFVVRRGVSGAAATVPFVVVDSCGEWRTFAGGGPEAF
jgi:hypothetical protein